MENNKSLMYGYIKNKLRQAIDVKENKISEGLIMTHNVDKVSDYLKRWGDGLFDVVVYRDLQLIVINPEKYDKTVIDWLFKYMNNMGYFFSTYVKDGKLIGKDYDGEDYDGLRFEAKYDMGANLQSNLLYHVTDKKNLDKILKIGLTPKTKSKIGYHPDRIYLALDKDSLEYISEMFKMRKFITNPIYFQINIDGLPNKFFIDNQFDGGVYTHENIPPSNITQINI